MGLKAGEVRLSQHNPHWTAMFKHEVEELWEYFGDYALRISHIGSTAVDDIETKPIIDIAVAVRRLSDFDKVSKKFSKNPDYSIKRNLEKEEILIRKGEKLNRSFYIHVMEIHSKRYRDAILFRDTLLEDEKIREDYRKLKHNLARKYPHDRHKYSSTKANFIETTLDLVWARTTLLPISVISLVTLIISSTSLIIRHFYSSKALFFGVSVNWLTLVGLVFGGLCFVTTFLSSIVLSCRYLGAQKRYEALSAKINKDFNKLKKKS